MADGLIIVVGAGIGGLATAVGLHKVLHNALLFAMTSRRSSCCCSNPSSSTVPAGWLSRQGAGEIERP